MIDNLFDIKINEAYHYFHIQRYEQALEALCHALSAAPDNSRALYLKACCHYNLDEYSEALDSCLQSLQSGYDMVECNYLLGRIYMNLDELVKSEQSFLEALRNDSQHAAAMAAYGMLMLKTGHEKKADQLMEEAMRIDPEDSTVLHYKFMYYLFRNKKSKQIALLQRFINSADNEVSKLIHTGMYHMHNKRYKEARESFRQAFLMNPTDQSLLGILKDLDMECSLWYLPQRFINRVGPAVLWLSFIAGFFLLDLLKMHKLKAIMVLTYLSLVIYSWVIAIGVRAADSYKNRRKKRA